MPANPATPLRVGNLRLMADTRANLWAKLAVATLTFFAAWGVIDSMLWPWASPYLTVASNYLTAYFDIQPIFHLQ